MSAAAIVVWLLAGAIQIVSGVIEIRRSRRSYREIEARAAKFEAEWRK